MSFSLRRTVSIGMAAALTLSFGALALVPTASAQCAIINPGKAGVVVVEVGGCGCRIAAVQWYDQECQDPIPGGIVPCVRVNLTLARPEGTGNAIKMNETLAEESCDPRHGVQIEWNATPFAGSGSATFIFDSQEAQSKLPNLTTQSASTRPWPVSPLTALLHGLFPSASTPARLVEARGPLPAPRTAASGDLPILLPRIVVSVAFDVAWGGDCQDAHGTLRTSVNGNGASPEAPQGLFGDLCRLSTAPDDAALGAARAVAALAQGLVPIVPVPELGPLAGALASLVSRMSTAPAIAPPPPPAAGVGADSPAPDASFPSAPQPSDALEGEERASGDALVTLFGADGPLEHKENAKVQTPVATVDVHGGGSLDVPVFFEGASQDASGGAAAASPPAPSASALATERAGSPPADARLRVLPATQAPRGADEREALPASPPPGSVEPRAVARLAGAAAAGALFFLAAFALYQRVSSPAALRHPGRAALLRACQEMNRGATAGELATVVGMGRKTAEYHLHYLVRVGQLRIDRVAGAPKRFALHSVARPSPEPLPLGASVLARIHGRPGASATEIAQELGVPRLRVDGHVKDLLVDGRVTSRVEAGRRRLYPA